MNFSPTRVQFLGDKRCPLSVFVWLVVSICPGHVAGAQDLPTYNQELMFDFCSPITNEQTILGL